MRTRRPFLMEPRIKSCPCRVLADRERLAIVPIVKVIPICGFVRTRINRTTGLFCVIRVQNG
jgi:hypothetical protein